MRAKLGLPPVAGIARGFMSQGPASLPANTESIPVFQGTAAGRVGSPTTRADSPGGARAPAGYNNTRRTESPSIDLQGTSRIPRSGQQQQLAGGGARKALPRGSYGYGQGQGLAPPTSGPASASGTGSRISGAPSFEMDGKASYYAPGMQADSRENSMYEPLPAGRGVSGAYERERDPRTGLVYDEQSEYSVRDPRSHQSRNGYPNSNSKFAPAPVRNAGGRIPSQDRDLPPPPPPPQSQDDNDDEEEFEVIPGAEDANGFPDIPTPTTQVPPLTSSSSPPPVPRKSTDSYGRNAQGYGYKRPESALSSDSGLGFAGPRESTDSTASAAGDGMQSSLFRTEAQELRARWAAQEKEKEEREKRQRERERDQHHHQNHHKAMGFGSGSEFSTAPRANGGYFDRRTLSVGTNASSAASSEVQTPVSTGGGGVVRDSLYMSEAEFGRMRSDTGSGYGAGTSRKRRGRTKSTIARERDREEQEMARAAAEAAARKKWEKEQQRREEMEEEERKRVR